MVYAIFRFLQGIFFLIYESVPYQIFPSRLSRDGNRKLNILIYLISHALYQLQAFCH